MGEEHQARAPKRNVLTKAVPLTLLAILVAGGGYALWSGKVDLGESAGISSTNVATVNGAAISEDEFQARLTQTQTTYRAQGVNVDDAQISTQIRTQVLDQLINEELIDQYAANKGVTVTAAEIDQAVGTVRARFETDEAYQQELQNNNLTQEGLRDNLRRELLVQKVLTAYAQPNELSVTPDEVTAAYEQLSTQIQDIPPLEEVQAQVQAQLEQQKLATVAQRLITELRQAGAIEITAQETETPAAQ